MFQTLYTIRGYIIKPRYIFLNGLISKRELFYFSLPQKMPFHKRHVIPFTCIHLSSNTHSGTPIKHMFDICISGHKNGPKLSFPYYSRKVGNMFNNDEAWNMRTLHSLRDSGLSQRRN
jgi:hypothetical protein